MLLNYPDYTCISKRAKSINVPFKTPTPDEIAHLVIDSTWQNILGKRQCMVKYNRVNTTLPIGEFLASDAAEDDSPLLTRAASKLNKNLYASTSLGKDTGKIKMLQITYLPLQKSGEDKVARAIAISYMAALMRQFEPALTVGQNQGKVISFLVKGKGSRFYQQQVGAILYVVSDNGDKGVTFAVESVKLALSML
ncbi:MAG: DUF1454 family protein [Serratia symbiotica]|nr:DUF1454 family protein [Serratia symbiotica]